MPRSRQPVKKQTQPIERHDHHVVQAQARQGLQLRTRPLHPRGHEALFNRQHAIGIAVATDAPKQALGLQPCTLATGAFGVTAVFRQQHTDVHLVGLAFQVLKKPLDAVPLLVPFALVFGRTLDNPIFLTGGQLVPRCVTRDARCFGVAHQVVLALLPCRGLDGLDRTRPQSELLVGNDQAVINPDHTAKTPASLAGPHRRVKREHRRDRVGVTLIAFGAMQACRKTPQVERRIRRCRRQAGV